MDNDSPSGDNAPQQPPEVETKSETIRTPRTKDRPYFPSARKSAQDSRLTFEARGVLWYLLSKPDDWQVIVGDLMREGGVGRDKVKRILKELRDCGYLETELTRDELGAFIGKVDRLHETAIHDTENPYNGKPVQRKTRRMANPKIQNTDSLKREESKASDDAHENPVPPKAVRTRRRTTPKTPVKRTDVIFDAIADCAYGLKDTSNVNGKGSSIKAVQKIAVEQFNLEYGTAEPEVIAQAIRLFGRRAHQSQWFKGTFTVPFAAFLQNNRKVIEALFNPPSEPEPKPRQTMGMDELTGGAS